MVEEDVLAAGFLMVNRRRAERDRFHATAARTASMDLTECGPWT
jgi:hypothetical protein